MLYAGEGAKINEFRNL